jgi:hypothetical protein
MARLWQDGELREFLLGLIREVSALVEKLPEDELLSRSTADLVEQYTPLATVEPLSVGSEPVDGDVTETVVDVSGDFRWGGDRAKGFKVRASYEFTGDPRLFKHRPSTFQLVHHEAAVHDGVITIEFVHPGLDMTPEQARAALAPELDRIQVMAGYAAEDARAHNERVAEQIRALVENRKDRVRKRRDLAGGLGFPLKKRTDAPRPVPLARKEIGSSRPRSRDPGQPYRDEPALTKKQYEDALDVIRSTVLAMERTPSVASGKPEEELRDQILVQLNGTFTGEATGETFVQSGKTDILLKDGERHVFVGECKWWTGPSDCAKAIDQLLGYLPWRDEKAALILFIDRKDATAAIEKADEAIRDHPAFKRAGSTPADASGRRNYILGHPDDFDREIHLAALFAVLPKDRT